MSKGHFLDAERVNELVEVCRTLVRHKTINPPGDEEPAAHYVANWLSQIGFQAELVRHAPKRASVIARLKGNGQTPGVLFNGHLDVVPPGAAPWQRDPFSAQVEDGKIWGRGAADMKGGLAALMMAAKLIAQTQAPLRGDLIIAATADEEARMTGAQGIVAGKSLGALQAILIAEPTHNQIGLAERGVLWLQLETYGKTAHGSTPHLGHNAIMMMVALLTALEQLEIPFTPHPILGDFTRSINTIAGGVKTNVIPDRCMATVDMRTVPGQDHAAIIQQVEHLLKDLSQRMPSFHGAISQICHEMPPVETAPDQPVIQTIMGSMARATGRSPIITQVRFATEAGIYVPRLAVPTVICGPGDPALAHQPNEYVEIAELVEATEIYFAAAQQLLGRHSN